MAEDYKYQVSLSLPPVGQWAKGDMLNVRADHADELKNSLDKLFGDGAADRIVGRFFQGTLVELAFRTEDAAPQQAPSASSASGSSVCPECKQGQIVEKRRKDGKGTFNGCNNYPACSYIAR